MGIEPDERALSAWAALCLAILGASASALINASETLFLKRVGVEQLPWVLLASAMILVVTTLVVGRALSNADRPRWLGVVMLGLAAALVPLWWVLGGVDSAFIHGAFVVVARQVVAIGLLVFWMTLPDLVTGRQAKRLFAPIAAGQTCGAIAGSFASDPIARAISIEGLVLVVAGALVFGAWAARRMASACPRPGAIRAGAAEGGVASSLAAGAPVSAASPWRESLLFRLLLVLILGNGILSPILYYEFSAVVDLATQGPNGEAELLALYASFRGWMNVALLATQLWISGWLYHRIGLPLSLGLEPSLYLVGFSGLALNPVLPVAVGAAGSVRIAEEGIADPAIRTIYNLFPERLRSLASSQLEGPVARTGAVLGNGSVLAALAAGALPVLVVAALPLAAVCVASTIALRRAWPGLLLKASADHRLSSADTERLLDRSTLRALAPALADPDPRTVRAALALVLAAEPEPATTLLADAIGDASPGTRALIVDALHRLVQREPELALHAEPAAAALSTLLGAPSDLPADERADLLQTYARLTRRGTTIQPGSNALFVYALGDRAVSVRLGAIAELHQRRLPPPGVGPLDEVLDDALASGDVLLRRAARRQFVGLLRSTERDALWRDRLDRLCLGLEQRADRAETAEALVEVADSHGSALAPTLDRMLSRAGDRDPRVQAAVLRFRARAGGMDHVRQLLSRLASRQPGIAEAARDGLVALGPAVVPMLIEETESGTQTRRDAALATLRRLVPDPETLDALYTRQLEAIRKAIAIRAAIDAEGSAPGLVFRRLEERIDEGLFTLLGIASLLQEDERISELERRMRLALDLRRRDILLEALDSVLHRSARSDLMPLLESSSWARRGEHAAAALGRPLPNSDEAWRQLCADPDDLTRRLARTFAPDGVEKGERIGDLPGMLDPIEIAARLQEAPAFGRLPTDRLLSLAELLEPSAAEADEVIYAAGDEGDGLYFVVEGEVVLERDGGPSNVLTPGLFFGELSTLDGAPRDHTARARGSVRLLRLERDELLAMMEDAPGLGIAFSQLLAVRLRETRAASPTAPEAGP
jgi:AAA family ATP:ADP antiporter